MGEPAHKLIAEVMAKHQGYQACMAQSTWVCARSCGWRGETNGGRGQWEEHLSAEIDEALGGLTQEWAVRTGYGDLVDQVERDTALYANESGVGHTGLERWVSGWSEVCDA